jgi:hypothetical protein
MSTQSKPDITIFMAVKPAVLSHIAVVKLKQNSLHRPDDNRAIFFFRIISNIISVHKITYCVDLESSRILLLALNEMRKILIILKMETEEIIVGYINLYRVRQWIGRF